MAAYIVPDLIHDGNVVQRYDPEIGCTVYQIDREIFVGGIGTLSPSDSYKIQLNAMSVAGVPVVYSSSHPQVADAVCTGVRVVGNSDAATVKLVATYTQIPNQVYIPKEWSTNLESFQTNNFGSYIPTGIGCVSHAGDPLKIQHTDTDGSGLDVVGTSTTMRAAGVLSFTQFISGVSAGDTVDGYISSFNGKTNQASWRNYPQLSWLCTINVKQIFPTAFRIQWNFMCRPPYLISTSGGFTGDPIGGWWEAITYTNRETDGQIPSTFKRDLTNTPGVATANAFLAAYTYAAADYSTLPTGIA